MASFRMNPKSSVSWICSSCQNSGWTVLYSVGRPLTARRHLQTVSEAPSKPVPFRKQLKDEAKQRKSLNFGKSPARDASVDSRLDAWELTVGIEVHAQLNTERKLFSHSLASADTLPNTHTSIFDFATPGTQPKFEPGTLLPALRAALALNCQIQHRSAFDRKHYFYPDQPNGYQITQYYHPFAKDGYLTLDKNDDVGPEEGEVRVGIKQIQMEQDTAKTVQQPPDTALLDFNRVGHPLIEIITLPHIHHPKTAAAYVKKIQQILMAVGAVTTGMEAGGLRADVNVSVRRKDGGVGQSSYHGVGGLGQRTEIKNLSSFKAVEDAIIAERDRQIRVLEDGGAIEGETRGWTLGSTETRRLRGKEGEVDYRYMPDPDLPPIVINQDLIDHLSSTLPMLPDEQTNRLVNDYGLSMVDAKALISLNNGLRLDFFADVVAECQKLSSAPKELKVLGKTVANWTLMDLGSILVTNELEFSPDIITPASLASILDSLYAKRITGKTAKDLLVAIVLGDARTVEQIIREDDLEIKHLSDEEYRSMADEVVTQNLQMADKIRKGERGKLQWFVGQMMRKSGGKVDAGKAGAFVEGALAGL